MRKYKKVSGKTAVPRRRGEEAVQGTDELLQTLLDHTHMMVAYLDPKFNFVRVNRAYAEADGRVPSFFPGKNHFDMYPNAENQEIFQRVVETCKPYFAQAKPFEYAEHPERGVTYWDWSLVPIKGSSGAVSGLVLTLVNVTERERAERALRESEERLRNFMDSATDSLVLWDKELNLVEANEAALKTFAPSARKTEMIGKNILELAPALKKTGRYERYLEVIRTAKPFHVDDVILDPKFGERRVAVTAFKVGDGLGMVVTDITERKLAEEALKKAYDELEIRVDERTRELSAANIGLQAEIAERRRAEGALRESEEKYKTLVETSNDMIFTVDLKGNFLFTNQAFRRLLGYSTEEIKRTNGFELVHPEDLEIVKAQFALLVEGKNVGDMEYRYKTKDGSYISILNNASPILDSKGNVVAALGAARDITERKRAEQELTEYRDHLQELVEERTAEIRRANEQLQREIAERKQVEEGLEWELAINRELAKLSGALITRSSSIPDIANIILDSAKSLTDSEHGFVSSIDTKTGDAVAHTLTQMMGKECSVSDQDKRIVFPKSSDGRYQKLWGHALNSREAFFTNSPETHEAYGGTPHGHIHLENFLAIPAIVGEELVGQIALANSTRDYTERDLEAVKRLAEMYALAIQRGRAEEALKAEKEFTEKALNAQTDTFFVFEPSTGRAVRWNKAFIEVSGYGDEEIRSLKAPDSYYDEEDLKKAAAAAEKVLREGIVTVELSLITKDGRSIPTEYTGSAIRDSEGNPKYIIAVGRDVSERRRAEESLRESEEKFRSLAEQSPNMIFINKKGRVVYANRRCEEITGWKREEFYSPDFDFFDLIAPESKDLVKENFSRHARNEEVRPYEYALCTKDGRHIEAILNSKLITYGGEAAILGIVTDITERKRAEEELRKRSYDLNERVKELNCLYNIGRLIETPGMSLEGIFQGTVDLIPAAWQYPEITCARLVLGDRIFVTSNFRETAWNQASDITAHGNREGSLEVCYLEERPEGYEGPFLAEERNLLQAIVERLGRVIERKRAEEEIRKLNKSLEMQAADLAASNKELETFSYSVSHDLRAPLRTIDGFSRALLEDYTDKLDEQGVDCLNRVRAGTQRMGHLIDDLLNLSTTMRTEMRREETDLSEMTRAIAGELKSAQPKRQVEFVIQDGVLAHGDARLLREVLENLLRNAWKFTGKHAQARIEFGVGKQGDQTAYFVRDDGAGFDMNYAEKLFVPFQRLHPAAEFSGNGVGLALVSRIVSRHGGRVWAEGEVEKGATFYFTLSSGDIE